MLSSPLTQHLSLSHFLGAYVMSLPMIGFVNCTFLYITCTCSMIVDMFWLYISAAVNYLMYSSVVEGVHHYNVYAA